MREFEIEELPDRIIDLQDYRDETCVDSPEDAAFAGIEVDQETFQVW